MPMNLLIHAFPIRNECISFMSMQKGLPEDVLTSQDQL